MGLFNLFSKVPHWVKVFPDEGDRDVFKTMLRNGANLDEPREIIFCMYASRPNADKIVKAVRQKGWQCDVEKSADPDAAQSDQDHFIEVKKDGYVITADSFTEDKQLMVTLADKFQADYDGWYASV
ncbi:MAG TPA: ribonuclease E inhibitor RraB [Candidatus Saccharimonadales bacterium]|nr:ribonuclease E inhibitor RraB [Candidatus Saccharimonadales bacterium]